MFSHPITINELNGYVLTALLAFSVAFGLAHMLGFADARGMALAYATAAILNFIGSSIVLDGNDEADAHEYPTLWLLTLKLTGLLIYIGGAAAAFYGTWLLVVWATKAGMGI